MMHEQLDGATERFLIDADTLVAFGGWAAASAAWDRSADRLLADVRARNRRLASPSHTSENSR